MIDSFKTLMTAVARGLPLPVASIRNRRAFIFMENLLDLIEALLTVEAPGGVYLLRDERGSIDAGAAAPDRASTSVARRGCFPFPPGLLRLATECGRARRHGVGADRLAIDRRQRDTRAPQLETADRPR